MPLFIDFHQLDFTPTIEEVKQGHEADLAVKDKHGVKFLQFWYNEQATTIFCLMEAPTAEAIERCHWEGAGDTPCNIQEVEPLYLRLFMGEAGSLKHDLTMTVDGQVDPAHRTLLLITLHQDTTEYSLLPYTPSAQLKQSVIDMLSRFKGRFVEQLAESMLVGVFNSPTSALACIEDLNALLKQYQAETDSALLFRVALHSGQPLTHSGGFFERATQQTKRLCQASRPNQMVVSAHLKSMLETEAEGALEKSSALIKVLSEPEENFLHELCGYIEQHLTQESFNVNRLGEMMGISRPQLYRKTLALTGRSPNHFIRDIRMERAWDLLKNKKGNVSEVALAVGYANPSYFSKLFDATFGSKPSAFVGA